MKASTFGYTNRWTTAILLAGTLAMAGAAGASPPHKGPAQKGSYDYARVVESKPIYEEVNFPRQECWTERVGYERERERSYGGAVLGGVVGGILGNQVGKGTGKAVATAVGAATGAMVGDNIDNDGRHANASRPRYEERCRSVDQWERRLSGYDVTYRYRGRDYYAFLPYDPGERVRVVIDVRLAE